MKKLSARRRHPLAALVVLVLALAATGGLYAVFVPANEAKAETKAQSSLAIEEGKKLYQVGCASCHGTGGQGGSDGPALVGVGEAAVDFQVSTGRMPAQAPSVQVPKKPNSYSATEIQQLAAYIGSLGPGPKTPHKSQYDPAGGDVARGGELFRTNCAQCHNFTGSGGALTKGKYAPTLADIDPKYMYEAMQTGPQSMPVFPDSTLTQQGKKDVIAFLQEVNSDEAPNPGGLALGGFGPVIEGFFAWTFGIGLLVAVAAWVAARTAKVKKS